MKTNTLLYVGGCAGSFPTLSEPRPIWDPDVAPGGIRTEVFSRAQYGGRTTCFFLRHRDTNIIFDWGSGAIPVSQLILGMHRHEQREHTKVWALQTHKHLDHVHGLPESKLPYRPEVTIHFKSPTLPAIKEMDPGQPFMQSVLGSYFRPEKGFYPVPLAALRSTREHEEFQMGAVFNLDGISVRTIELTHPGGCCGYRLDIPGVGAVVVATDFEPGLITNPAVVEFFDGARLLLVDMQYEEKEYTGEKPIGDLQTSRLGWGHGTPERLFPLILACRRPPAMVRIVHHDPGKSDSDLDLFYQRSVDVLHQLNGGVPSIDFQFGRQNEAYWL